MLLDITTSDVVIEDTLPVDTYTLAVWGNYVYVDDQGRVVDEQYEADPEAGLENIRILHPEQEKNWGFAYAGTQKVSLSATTSDPVVQRIPIQRCVMQILFNRHGPYDNFDWNDAVASNIKLTGFSTHYNVYTDQASADADHPIIQLDRIDNREYAYYRMTLFESLQDCYIDLQYVNSDGSTTDDLFVRGSGRFVGLGGFLSRDGRRNLGPTVAIGSSGQYVGRYYVVGSTGRNASASDCYKNGSLRHGKQ